ncbi:MAG: exodeoxyribonuclease VII large subunit [Clostridiales bacterium]|nr:exodeoxyribonuclease VII large subunit [Clostridiales bacterium]
MYNTGTITVSGLNMYIKGLIDSDNNLTNIFVEGEISNFTNHYKSGHMYLSLKDERASIKAVMFSFNAKRLKFEPYDGMKVICRGRVGVYEPSGQYQLYIEDMQPDGAGALYVAFEQLKEKLEKLGLFDPSVKKPLPRFPSVIGVITSSTGAAIEDIKSILARRYPLAEVLLYPSLVQGAEAPKQLISGIKYFNDNKNADVIIIGRGGGSAEDLWAFNDEALAMEIYKSEIPVISAVGHETDFTICDFVADRRAPTPSAAAETAVPDKAELADMILGYRDAILNLTEKSIYEKEYSLNICKERLQSHNTSKIIEGENLRLDSVVQRFMYLSQKNLDIKKNRLDDLTNKLEAMNPLSVLKRGYSVAYNNGKAVRSVNDVKSGDNVRLCVSDGEISLTVDE